jgi:UDP-2-acetamido-3-amino-2,3-dideoxy-glucuronate N-acetyltransferase
MNDIYIHPTSDVQTDAIGIGSRIWQYVVVLSGSQIGEQCNICSHCLIENDVEIGNRVTIKSGVQLWNGIRISDDVFIGPNVSFSNDRYPRSKKKPEKFLTTSVHAGASIGAGAVILPGLTIGTNAMVGAGSVVTRSIPANAVVVGNPAKIVGYVDSYSNKKTLNSTKKINQEVRPTRVPSVYIHRLPQVTDIRGSLTVGEFERSIPFPVKRYFVVFNVPSKEVRGEHAHFKCHQFLICVRGSCSVVVDDGVLREELLLDSPDVGVHLPPMVWGTQYKYTQDAVLLVFASDYYDASDYIRSYENFLEIVKRAE